MGFPALCKRLPWGKRILIIIEGETKFEVKLMICLKISSKVSIELRKKWRQTPTKLLFGGRKNVMSCKSSRTAMR